MRWPTLVAVRGESMRPSLRNGDLAVAYPADGCELVPGQIVLAPGMAGLVIHRLVAVGQYGGRLYCLTAGDANRAVDRLAIPADAILGVVAHRLPGLGLLHLSWSHVWALGSGRSGASVK